MSLKILSIPLLLSSCCHYSADTRGHPGATDPCCVDITKGDMTADVVGQTYRELAARRHCIKAILFNTKRGLLCADPNTQWVKDLTAKMENVSPIEAPLRHEALHRFCVIRICP